VLKKLQAGPRIRASGIRTGGRRGGGGRVQPTLACSRSTTASAWGSYPPISAAASIVSCPGCAIIAYGLDCLTGTQVMSRLFTALFAAGLLLAVVPAFAQVVPFPPVLQGRIPAPVSPAAPPVINGPLGKSPPPGPYVSPRLNTFADRKTQCIDQRTS
jgi:hypothetical protein